MLSVPLVQNCTLIMATILIVDDERSIRSSIREILEFEKYTVVEASSGQAALELLATHQIQVVLSDVKMNGMDGIEFLRRARGEGFTAEFVMLSAHGSIELAVEATRIGAYDFIQKPPDLNRLLVAIRNAAEKGALLEETVSLRKRVAVKDTMVGRSAALEQIKSTVARVARTDARVLITGPNGSGKELVARALHSQSNRADKPFVEVNCAAIPSELIESELFGHEKGSFTSAIRQRIGKFEQAEEGTLFLDEVGDMSASAQAKVLRALQEHRIVRVGGERDIEVHPRVIAATNKDLRLEIARGTFREDLFHRLGVIIIRVPSLNERLEDMQELVAKFAADITQEYGMSAKRFEPEVIPFLKTLNWSGNIRELRNVIERLIILSDRQIDLKLAQTHTSEMKKI
jgi:two-component system, NtrC family, nitrogen regulation response regulator NtrX